MGSRHLRVGRVRSPLPTHRHRWGLPADVRPDGRLRPQGHDNWAYFGKEPGRLRPEVRQLAPSLRRDPYVRIEDPVQNEEYPDGSTQHDAHRPSRLCGSTTAKAGLSWRRHSLRCSDATHAECHSTEQHVPTRRGQRPLLVPLPSECTADNGRRTSGSKPLMSDRVQAADARTSSIRQGCAPRAA
jgi:hypothetical protein